MRVFRRRSAGATDGTAQDSPGAQSPDGPADAKPARPAEAAKGRPTPKRSEAERGRRQPITGSRAAATPRTPETKAKTKTERSRKYEAMRRGEAWALNPRDRGPARALARDYVDSKRRISEYYMYILVILVVAVFSRNKTIESIVTPIILVLVVVILIDAQLIRRSLRRLMAQRLPGESTRGLTTYAVFRALQIRRFRLPAPRVQPGAKILSLVLRVQAHRPVLGPGVLQQRDLVHAHREQRAPVLAQPALRVALAGEDGLLQVIGGNYGAICLLVPPCPGHRRRASPVVVTRKTLRHRTGSPRPPYRGP